MKRDNSLPTGLVVLFALIGVAFATTMVLFVIGPDDKLAATHRAPATVAPAADDFTRETFEITWGMTSESDKDVMCGGLAMFGHDWAVRNLEAGGGLDSDLNWDAMADMVQEKCDAEGR